MWGWVAAALAGSGAYDACCRAMEADCPASLEIVGPATAITEVRGGTALRGLWVVSCGDGPFFDSERTRSADRRLGDGDVLTPLSPEASACFDAACKLPERVCLTEQRGHPRAVGCKGEPAARQADWLSPVRTATPVILQGRVLRATRMPLAGASVPATPRRPPDSTVPGAPPEPCIPDNAMRAASNQQVEQGNEAMLATDPATALDRYRAAISIMPCNPFAWAALGDTLLHVDQPGRARRALLVTVRLMPTHYQAWTRLGRAHEALGEVEEATAAYGRALELRPDHEAARRGLRRLTGQ